MSIRSANQGFTLIEVLIAMLVLATGLLGMASLTLHSMKSNQNSYQRTQASLLAYDMAERLRLNPSIATGGNNYVIASTSSPGNRPSCSGGGCSTSETTALDIFEWSSAVNSEGLTGTVTRSNSNLYTITINWNTSFTAADSGCGAGTCSFVLEVNL